MSCPICVNDPRHGATLEDLNRGVVELRRCAFADDPRSFSKNNWMCGAMIYLRNLGRLLRAEVHIEDNTVTTLPLVLPDDGSIPDEAVPSAGEVVMLGRYKNRGDTAWAHVLNTGNGERRDLRAADVHTMARMIKFYQASGNDGMIQQPEHIVRPHKGFEVDCIAQAGELLAPPGFSEWCAW